MPPGTVSRPWRRYLRFSLRALIVVVLVIGGGMGWIVRSARIQRAAVAAIKDAGGMVYYDWEWSNGKRIPAGKPGAPEWLTDLMGVDYFGHVTLVHLGSSSTATSRAMAHVGNLTRLERLIVNASSVRDADLAHLKRLTNLSELFLSNTPISDPGLVHLKGLTGLSSLELHGTHVTDAGLVHLKGLTGLRILCLAETPVTDRGLAHLKRLTGLSVVNLMYTQISGGGVTDLQQALPRLRIDR